MAEISWMDWGKETFDRAEREGKLILLWLTGSWCQWSREMERSTFTREDVVSLANGSYVPVRVDADRRPDIDLRYNQGALPSEVVITPAGELVSGATYLGPDRMAVMLSQAEPYYRANPDALVRESRAATERLVEYERASVTPGAVLDREQVVTMMRSLLERCFDAEYGGFYVGGSKFLHLDALSFLLHQSYFTGEERYRDMVTKTLDVIGNSSLYDLEEGGVFRCSATRDWNEPSSEKILEDNAGFLRLCLEVYQMTGWDRYREAADAVAGYIATTLTDREHGGFFGSQASDERYYLMPLSERRGRDAPPIDTTILTAPNGRAICSFCYAADILGRPELLDFAALAARRLLAESMSDGMGMFRYNDGTPRVPGLLVDQVHAALALVCLADATGSAELLAHAESLAAYMISHLRDDGDGKFRDAPEDSAALANLRVERKPFGPNVEAARLLHELHLRTGNPDYTGVAERLLLALRQRYLDLELQGAGFADLVDYIARPAMVATVIGRVDENRTTDLRRAATVPYYPKKVVRVLAPESGKDEASRGGLSLEKLPLLVLSKDNEGGEFLSGSTAVGPAMEALAAELRNVE